MVKLNVYDGDIDNEMVKTKYHDGDTEQSKVIMKYIMTMILNKLMIKDKDLKKKNICKSKTKLKL